jgi:transposase-like protein
LQVEAVEIGVSDGCLGLPKAMKSVLPQTQSQRCIPHKVRGPVLKGGNIATIALLSAIMPNMTVKLWRKIRDTNAFVG